jgi:uncharacterized repeat protein (TIGR03806 family)
MMMKPGQTYRWSRRAHVGFGMSLTAVLLLHAFATFDAAAAPGLASRPANNTCVAPQRPVTGPGLGVEVVANQDISWPLEMLQAPGDSSRWYVVDRSGYVAIYSASTFARIGTLIDISDRVRRTLGGREWNEMGLLSMAFHPNFQNNRRFYLYYSRNGTGNTVLEGRVSRFTANAAGTSASPASESVVLRFDRDKQWHWGGRLAFGPDRYLYLSIGDGGTHRNAQDRNSINGKMIRIDVSGANPYTIPPDNPYAGGGGRPEIYALGLRNPWRYSWDSATGELWEGDVGSSSREEVNIIVKGGNYGWSDFEGTRCHFSPTCDYGNYEPPVLDYTHNLSDEISGSAVIGGYVYRGSAIPAFYGTYLFGDTNGKLFGFNPATSGPTALLGDTRGYTILSFAEDPSDREIYALTVGAILRLVAAGGGGTSNFPERLSESRCARDGDPTLPAFGLIPYDVNMELWSDGAQKRRWMGVPNNKQITVNDDGDFDFPRGTVLVKEFRLNQQPVETRWMVRHNDDGQWAGYSFEWNDAGTDATLVPPEGKKKQVGNQLWTFPSRNQCLTCHSAAAGRTLGLEVAQLNGDYHYWETGLDSNQLETLEFIGMFDAPLPDSPARLDALPHIDDQSASLDDRARAYLHANCAICHRPGGPGQGPEDFRYWLPTYRIGAVNVEASSENFGIPDAKLIDPGFPNRSVMLLRTETLNPSMRMPPLATAIVDPEGTKVLRNWIASMPPADAVEITHGDYNATNRTLFVRAFSDQGLEVRLTAYTKNNGVLTSLGNLVWKDGYHQMTFNGVTTAPACIAVSSSGGGHDEFPVAGSCGSSGATEVPLVDWTQPTGGVLVSANRIRYTATPQGWDRNTINSKRFGTLGYNPPFEVRFTIDRNPADTTWIVGLGRSESSADWRDVDYGMRSSEGALKVYESGTWRTNGPALKFGDVLSLYVEAGTIEYRVNGDTIYTSTYGGSPNFYVDTSFNDGAIALLATVVATFPDPSAQAIWNWTDSTGGVSDTGNSLSYSGTPETWSDNSINSAPLSLFGATDDYKVEFTVGRSPSATDWIVGLGVQEADDGWRDVDFGLRSLGGVLAIYEKGAWILSGDSLVAGDRLGIAVHGTMLEYRVNGQTVHSRTVTAGQDYYIDTSFKTGAMNLENFVLSDD